MCPLRMNYHARYGPVGSLLRMGCSVTNNTCLWETRFSGESKHERTSIDAATTRHRYQLHADRPTRTEPKACSHTALC
jgi:hypothetical protein